jgi:hypothetical protein
VYVYLVYFRRLQSRCQAYVKDVLGPLLLNIFINDLCEVINHSNCLLFADDLKVYRAINSPSDCLLLQSDIACVRAWCSNFMKPILVKLELFLLLGKRTS